MIQEFSLLLKVGFKLKILNSSFLLQLLLLAFLQAIKTNKQLKVLIHDKINFI